MNSIQFHHINSVKSKKVFHFSTVRAFTNVFRLIELLLVVVLFSKLFFKIPVAVKFSGELFREAGSFLVSPRFVFVVGNVIVITLFAKSGKQSDQYSPIATTTATIDINQNLPQNQKREERSEINELEILKPKELRSIEEKRVRSDTRIFRRSQSTEISPVALKIEKNGGKLRRYESEKYLRICDSDKRRYDDESDKYLMRICDSGKQSLYPEDGMSNEEFNSKIEDFIARQKRFQKDEEHTWCW